MTDNIVIYTSNFCSVCHMLREFLSDMNIPFKEVNIDLKPIEMAKLVRKTRKLSVPQTNINGDWIFGFDPVQMLEKLQTSPT